VQRPPVAREHLVQGESPAGAHHAADFGVEARLVGHVHRAVLHPNHVEGRVVEGHGDGAARLERDPVSEPGAGGEHRAHPAVGLGEVEHRDPAPHRRGERARRPADAAADVEHVVAGPQARQAREFARGLGAPRVELVHGREVGPGEPVGVGAGGPQRGQDAVA
jgi:hypothetical protein